MNLSPHLIVAGQTFNVLKIERGLQVSLHLTLDRAPHLMADNALIMVLVEGVNREPVRLVEASEGARLTVRRIY